MTRETLCSALLASPILFVSVSAEASIADHFRTSAPSSAVQRAACSLDANVSVDGRTRPLELSGCGSREGALHAELRVEEDGGERNVFIAVEVPEGFSEDARAELETIVRETMAELRRRIAPEESMPIETDHVVVSKPEWYGWQTLIPDAASIVLISSAIATSATRQTGDAATGLAFAGMGTYALGAPVVHWAHGNIAIGFASMAARFFFPLSTGFIGIYVGAGATAVTDCSGLFCGLGTMATGGMVGYGLGMLTCSIVDAAAAAYEKPEPTRKSARIVPSISPTKNGATVHVLVTF